MDAPPSIATLLLVGITVLVSLAAFKNHQVEERLIFSPRLILAHQEYYRLFTSAFIHLDGRHLLFNMVSLYLFGRNLEALVQWKHLLIIYFASVAGGSLVSLYLHRNHDYQALGASGGVCGVIFASIFLLPGGRIYMMPLPVGIPSWLCAILFMIEEFKGLRSPASRVGHDAHLGGAIIGLLVTTALYPDVVKFSPWLYVAILSLSGAMFLYLWLNPLQLPLRNFFDRSSRPPRKPPRPTELTAAEVDAILEKISTTGLHSLSERERQILRKASKK